MERGEGEGEESGIYKNGWGGRGKCCVVEYRVASLYVSGRSERVREMEGKGRERKTSVSC